MFCCPFLPLMKKLEKIENMFKDFLWNGKQPKFRKEILELFILHPST